MSVGVFQGTGSASVAAGRTSGSTGGVHGTAHNSTLETLQNVRSKWVRNRGVEKGSLHTTVPTDSAESTCDDDIVAVCDEISENLVVAADANEYSLF